MTDRLTGDAANLWRRQSDCGCHVVGGGTINAPLTVAHCPRHSEAPAMLDRYRLIAQRDCRHAEIPGDTAPICEAAPCDPCFAQAILKRTEAHTNPEPREAN